MLFRSVQTGTKENLKMIATQRDALETARKSREDALKATKVRQDELDLSTMSHNMSAADQKQLFGIYEPRAENPFQVTLFFCNSFKLDL
jgi:hypothetical protein